VARVKPLLLVGGPLALLLLVFGVAVGADLTPTQQLGKAIFFDETLSLNGNQSCATCHDPDWGFTGPDSAINAHGAVYEGSIAGAFGDRKPPASAYTAMSPILYRDRSGTFVGGNFWDGRATGERLGSPVAEQAQGPFLNPVEQALAEPADVVGRICGGSYGDLFRTIWGPEACDPANVATAYDAVGYSIAAYEGSPEVDSYSSKYDTTFTGKAKLSKLEQRGLALFRGKGGCAACHPAGKGAVFTDFTYDNLGVPKNPENPVYAVNPGFVDPGLGGFLATRPDYAAFAEDEMGKHKVPTLRNVDRRPSTDDVKAYGHNGYFKSLYGIVHFYNTRDTLPTCPGDYTEAQALAANCWPAPEVAENVNEDELGDLGLTLAEEDAIVAFLATLSDGWTP
jgi:cytochrome c peroxidase